MSDEDTTRDQQESAEEAERLFQNRVATIQAPTEEMKAFSAGLRVGFQRGYELGFAVGVESIAAQKVIIPSEVLFNKPD